MSPGRGEGRRRARAGAGHARVHTGKGDETTSGPTKLQTTQHGDGAAGRALPATETGCVFQGGIKKNWGFNLGSSLGNVGSEPCKTLRPWGGLLESRPASGPRRTQGQVSVCPGPQPRPGGRGG